MSMPAAQRMAGRILTRISSTLNSSAAGSLAVPVLLLALSLCSLIIVSIWAVVVSGHFSLGVVILLLISGLLGLVTLWLLVKGLNLAFLQPLSQTRAWLSQLQHGRYTARLPEPHGAFNAVSHQLNDLGDELRSLNLEMSARVGRHTQNLARKTRSLEILYDIASTLSNSRTLEEIFENFLDTFVQLFDARAAMVRLVTENGQLRLVASRGLDADVIEREKLMPMDHCPCGLAGRYGIQKIQKGAMACEQVIGMPLLGTDCRELVAVPIQYHDKTLGVYTLVLDKPISDFGDDLGDLLTSIGRHLGMAVEKAHLDDDARRLAIIEERNIIGNELHDSLAQSLVSMRLHVKMLGEILFKKDLHGAQHEVRRLHLSLEEAHTSLRELLANFRSRMDERGLVPAIEDMVMQFQEETGIVSYFQNDCRDVILAPAQEIQVFRIIQESLANIRKHSDARTARILLRSDDNENYRLLIEDDGLGITPTSPAQRGEHVGLAIMRERADQLGGALSIESDPGEGTRVQLTFSTSRPVKTRAS